jgi:lycopene epsilon-cyclase
MEFTGATISAPFGCRALRGGGPLRTPGWGADGRRRRVSSGPGAEQSRSWKVSCVATEKPDEKAAAAAAGLRVDFADEEDYVKGGGGELLYVRMQATKAMDSQSKIASKVTPYPPSILFCTTSSILFFVFFP